MPLLWFSLAFLLGLMLAAWQPGVPGWVWLSGGMVSLGLAFLENRLIRRFSFLVRWRSFARIPVCILLTGVFLGTGRYAAALPDFSSGDLAFYNDRGKVRVVGIVSSPPDVRGDAVLLRIRALKIDLGDSEKEAYQSIDGSLLARLPDGGEWRYGDEVELVGTMETPPEFEDFSYRDYLARKRIYSYMRTAQAELIAHRQGSPLLGAVYGLRREAYKTLNQLLPQPEAGLLSGILLGIENDLPPDLEEAFIDTGTFHIIAISGFNIAIIAGLFMALSSRIFPMGWSFFVALGGIAFYTILVGAQPPVVRAAVMGGVGLFGRQIGRSQVGVNSLAFTAAVMSFFNPLLPWDAGFQLSFMATLGLVLYGEPLQKAFEGFAESRFGEEAAARMTGPVSEFVLFTLAAQITTLPVIAYHFGRISLSAFLANPLILPPQPLVMTLGGITVLTGMVLKPVGQLLAYLLWPVLAYTIQMVELLARLPGGLIMTGKTGLFTIFLYYAAVIGIPLSWKKLSRLQIRVMPSAVLVGLALVGFAVWRAVLSVPGDRLHLTLLNSPDENAAVLIQTPGGRSMLLGSNFTDRLFMDKLRSHLPPYRQNLDLVMLPAGRRDVLPDEITTLATRFSVKMLLFPENSNFHLNRTSLEDKQVVEEHSLVHGQVIDLGEGASLEVLVHSSSGTALLLEWDRLRILFPGEISRRELLCTGGVNLDGLSLVVFTHQEENPQRTSEWLQHAPFLVLAPQTEGVYNASSPIYGYSSHDWVQVVSDGERLWLNASR